MKMYQAVFILTFLFVTAFAGFTNTTSFWQNMVKDNQLHFQTYAGYEEIDWYYAKNTTGMYYSLFSAMGHKLGNNQSSADIPLIIWLQGGPGASSQFGAFAEIGPIRISNNTAKLFHSSWNIFGHLLFIDQPLNVGFSYKPGDRQGKDQLSDSYTAADQLLNFLDNFYKTWPALRESPLYISGQSYAGHYVPAIARKLIINQTLRNTTGVKLQGIALGDAWVDHLTQGNFYDSYLWSLGIVQTKFRDIMTWVQTQGILSIYNQEYRKAAAFDDFLSGNDTTREVYFGNISVWNFRQYQYPEQSYIDFLQNNRNQLGAKVDYIDGNDAIYDSFRQDFSKSFTAEVALALKNIKVLIYQGQEDFCVNTPGVLQYVNSLVWDGLSNWKRTKKQIWTIHGENAGWAKISGNLWFALVNGAGHMVPADQPQRAFSLLGHFINSENIWNQ